MIKEFLITTLGIMALLLVYSWLSLRDAEITLKETKATTKQCKIGFNASVDWVPCTLVNEKLAKVSM